ncbi:MAG: D-alanine--D-alanine ligase family protein [Planctomycetota bacterium]|jgi:D-alanine-D-alanine ligase
MRTVAVIYGGPSLEHDVSLESGTQVLEHLDRSRYAAVPVLIGRDGSWNVDGERCVGALDGAVAMRERGCDVGFIALHGPFGEDGTVQGFLEAVGLPFTGSRVAGSALSRDKVRAKRMLAAYGIEGAPDVTVPPATTAYVKEQLGFPVVVKNPIQGSTLGLELADDEAQFEVAVARLAPGCEQLLVERREAGREFTVPVLDDADGAPQLLPLVEIRAPGGMFDFEAKYTEGAAEEIVNPEVDAAVARRMGEWSLTAHTALGLRGFSRTDLILRPDGSLVFLETNSIPGLTANSLLPKSAAAAGLEFPALLSRLVENAFRGPRSS